MFAPTIPTFTPDVADCGQTQTFVHGHNINPAYYSTAPQVSTHQPFQSWSDAGCYIGLSAFP